MKNIRFFYLKNCHVLVVKFSIYLNRRVFAMDSDQIDRNLRGLHRSEGTSSNFVVQIK